MSTLVGESVVAKRVYQNCLISFPNRVSYVDLVEIDMLDFDIILGIDLLHACFSSIDYRTRVVRFNFPNKPVVKWEEGNSIPRGHIISCLKACKMISKVCLYHIVRVQNLNSKIPPIELVPVVNEFLEVFLNDILGSPFEREIDFGINLLPKTNPISIPPYWLARDKLKELKAQLKEFLGKGFIRPNISPWGASVLFIKKKDGFLRMCIEPTNSKRSPL